MRLVNTSTLQLEQFSSTESTPPYAILSHTWGKDLEEVTFEDMKSDRRSPEIESRPGFEKVKMTCQLAREVYKLNYAWVDTCCIDKSSSAELSESINSMFKWYQHAVLCLAFLADWQPDDHTFAHCNWFTRGWTLQELIASQTVIFYDSTWQARGDKATLCSEISTITRIKESVLNGQIPLSKVPVAVRMSWASKRVTTRVEDIAYCLLGIFDIYMPMLYGEGNKAFLRLQEEIIKEHPDMSIFAWRALPESSQEYMGMLAPSPKEFLASNLLYPSQAQLIVGPILEFSVSNRGVKFLLPCLQGTEAYTILPVLHFPVLPGTSAGGTDIVRRTKSYGVYLRTIGPQIYVRALPRHFAEHAVQDLATLSRKPSPIIVSKSISATDSENVSRRAIHLREPLDLLHPDFRLRHPLPTSNWSASSRTLFATAYGEFEYQFSFHPVWSVEFSSFTLLCRFKNPRGAPLSPGFWQCDVVRRTQQSPPSKLLFPSNHRLTLSSHQPISSRMEKVLVLPHVRDAQRSKRVVLWLQRETNATTGLPEFSMGLQVHDKDIRMEEID